MDTVTGDSTASETNGDRGRFRHTLAVKDLVREEAREDALRVAPGLRVRDALDPEVEVPAGPVGEPCVRRAGPGVVAGDAEQRRGREAVPEAGEISRADPRRRCGIEEGVGLQADAEPTRHLGAGRRDDL